jgi:hypothetical protein
MILWLRDWLYLFYIEAHSIHSLIKQSAENYLSTMMLKKTFAQSIWTSILKDDTEASQLCMQHRDSISSDAQNFLKNEVKILYIMQFLMRKSQNTWYWHQKTIPLENISWEYFINYLLNFVKDSVNHQLHNAQTYTETVQKLSQSVHAFAAYFSTLKVQLMLYNEKQLIMHFFTKLQLEIRKILLNY